MIEREPYKVTWARRGLTVAGTWPTSFDKASSVFPKRFSLDFLLIFAKRFELQTQPSSSRRYVEFFRDKMYGRFAAYPKSFTRNSLTFSDP